MQSLLEAARQNYYNGIGDVEMCDEDYDAMEEFCDDYQIGAIPAHSKCTLPVPMGSLKKMRKQEDILKWTKCHASPYFVLNKLDGISCLLEYNVSQTGTYTLANVYSRGNGILGSNLNSKLPNTNIPITIGVTGHGVQNRLFQNVSTIYIRGELLIPREQWQKRSDTYSSARTMVSSLCNTIGPVNEMIHFVAYQVVSAEMDIQDQLHMLSKWFCTVNYTTYKTIDVGILYKRFMHEKQTSVYDLDGLVICDISNPDMSMIPKNKIAYKPDVNERKVTTITHIEWNPCKSGFLIPTICFEPVTLGTSVVKRATGHNARNVVERCMGVGSKILVEKSGDIIPKIVSVIEPVPFDTDGFKWCVNEVNFISVQPSHKFDMLHFFKTLQVKSAAIKFTEFLESNGIYTPEQFLESTTTLQYGRYVSQGTYSKIKDATIAAVKRSSLPLLLVALNVFGPGIHLKKMQMLTITRQTISKNTASQNMWDSIKDNIGVAMQRLNKVIELCGEPEFEKVEASGISKNICISGFRDDKFKHYLQSNGYNIQDSVTRTTDIVVTNSFDVETTKTKKAKQYGINIVLREYFIQHV